MCRYTIHKAVYVTATRTHTYVYMQKALYMTTTVIRIDMYKIQKDLYMTATGIRRYRRQKALYLTTNGVRMHVFWNTEVFKSDNRWHTRIYSENGLHVTTTRVSSRRMRQPRVCDTKGFIEIVCGIHRYRE
jgi:hypothetical protein